MTARIIALVNQKGGVGKTTSTINIGAGLTQHGRRVLLVDIDPQASLTTALGLKGVLPTLYEVLKGQPAQEAIRSHETGDGRCYHVLPSGINLSGAELELAGVAGRECVLQEALADCDGYDYIFIDCPPSLSLLTLNALVAAQEVIVAMQTEFLAMEGMAQLMDTIGLVQRRLNKSLKVSGIVPTQYDNRKGLHREVLGAIREHFGDIVFKTPIRNSVALAEAAGWGQDIFQYRPRGNGASDYHALVSEIIAQERGK